MWLYVDMSRQKFTTKQVAEQYAVSEERVTSWIRARRLKAENIAAGSRKVYRITESALEAFDRANSSH